MATTDVEKKSPLTKDDLAVAKAAILDGEPLATSGYADAELISRQIAERILNAETFEEAFQVQELKGWVEILDVACEVKGFHLNPTGYDAGGSSVYAVVDLTRLDTGEAETVTCGGRNVLAQLVKMLEKGWLDRPVKLTAKGTAEGYQVLWLVPA